MSTYIHFSYFDSLDRKQSKCVCVCVCVCVCEGVCMQLHINGF